MNNTNQNLKELLTYMSAFMLLMLSTQAYKLSIVLFLLSLQTLKTNATLILYLIITA